MKYIYIAGLEHSGTTLTDHLLSQQPGAIGLGEIASFFSADHMAWYLRQWGANDDAMICSCGRDWEHCEFWGDIIGLCGLYSDQSLREKYGALVSYIRETRGDAVIIIDSSKSQTVLESLLQEISGWRVSRKDFLPIFNIKDVRSFSASVIAKMNTRRSVVAILRSFNWWLAENRTFMEFIETEYPDFVLNSYERLCADPESFCRAVSQRLDLPRGDDRDGESHIAMGNKNFLNQNRARISYDARWHDDRLIKLAYLLHHKARAFNKDIYERSQGS